jgi:hypothetical protein
LWKMFVTQNLGYLTQTKIIADWKEKIINGWW